jgi:hypothetical protein
MPVENESVKPDPIPPAPRLITFTQQGNSAVWVSSYTFAPPADSVTSSSQSVRSLPPGGHTSAPAGGPQIVAGPVGPPNPDLPVSVPSWVYPAPNFPGEVQMAFIIQKGVGSWPNPVQVTITLTYTGEGNA